MYSYKESVKSDVRDWMEENRDQWEGLDRHDVYEVVYDACWVADGVTGNASSSYTFSRYEARQNFFEDDDSDEYISQMIEDGFTTKESVGRAVSESQWELLDVSIRCWLLTDAVTEILDEMFED